MLGDEVDLGCRCLDSANTPGAPTVAVTMIIVDSSGTLVVSKAIPPSKQHSITGRFAYKQPLNSSFSTGTYFVFYNWAISGTDYGAEDEFDILAGGNASGQYISLFHLDRPDGVDFVLGQIDQGGVVINRGPKI